MSDFRTDYSDGYKTFERVAGERASSEELLVQCESNVVKISQYTVELNGDRLLGLFSEEVRLLGCLMASGSLHLTDTARSLGLSKYATTRQAIQLQRSFSRARLADDDPEMINISSGKISFLVPPPKIELVHIKDKEGLRSNDLIGFQTPGSIVLEIMFSTTGYNMTKHLKSTDIRHHPVIISSLEKARKIISETGDSPTRNRHVFSDIIWTAPVGYDKEFGFELLADRKVISLDDMMLFLREDTTLLSDFDKTFALHNSYRYEKDSAANEDILVMNIQNIQNLAARIRFNKNYPTVIVEKLSKELDIRLEKAKSYLFGKYHKLIKSSAYHIAFRNGFSSDELYGSALEGFNDAIRLYDVNKAATFSGFAIHRTEGACMDFARNFNGTRKARKGDFELISIDQGVRDVEDRAILDTLVSGLLDVEEDSSLPKSLIVDRLVKCSKNFDTVRDRDILFMLFNSPENIKDQIIKLKFINFLLIKFDICELSDLPSYAKLPTQKEVASILNVTESRVNQILKQKIFPFLLADDSLRGLITS